jgi:hypothetical protein
MALIMDLNDEKIINLQQFPLILYKVLVLYKLFYKIDKPFEKYIFYPISNKWIN